MRRLTAPFSALTCITIAAFLPSIAHAEDANEKATCVTAYEQGQILRQHGELEKARAELRVCSRDACPVVLSRDCTRWLDEVERAIATVVFVARDEHGMEILDVRVIVDGRVLANKLDGRALSLDAGEHTLRFERPPSKPVEKKLVVHEGEKSLEVPIVFAADAPPSPRLPPPPAPVDEPVHVTWPMIALAGVSVVGMTSFAIFGISGHNEQLNVLEACKPNCTSSQIDSVRTKYLIADVSLAVSLITLGAATALFFTHPHADGKTSNAVSGASSTWAPALGVAPLIGGAQTSLSVQF